MADDSDIQRTLGLIEGRLTSIDNNITRLMAEAKDDRSDHRARFGAQDERLRKLERNQTYIAGGGAVILTVATFFKDKIFAIFS